MRSESRTEETSGLVTTMASSAKYMARCAPFSMPAGESQMTYSEVLAQLVDHLADAFPGEGVLVARLAGSKHVEVLQTLVLDQDWVRVASPLMTLTKS